MIQSSAKLIMMGSSYHATVNNAAVWQKRPNYAAEYASCTAVSDSESDSFDLRVDAVGTIDYELICSAYCHIISHLRSFGRDGLDFYNCESICFWLRFFLKRPL